MADKECTTIVRAVLGLANGFNLETTAEGIENDEQLASLSAEGCLHGQGYLFDEAVPANDVQSLLESHKLMTRLSHSRGWHSFSLMIACGTKRTSRPGLTMSVHR
jgi:sensor c-di-GMP phosphodiesterase-like protein